MEIVKRAGRMRELVRDMRRREETIGFVPTMGFLHDGHRALLRRARDMTDRVVMSLFINPLQFGPGEDYEEYPRDSHRDTEIAKTEGVDYVFMPEAKEMYPEGFSTSVTVDRLENRLCGEGRPGHFRGVCTVVAKLFSLVAPQFAFFGQKDAQQLLLIERMVRDLSFEVEVVGCTTVREADGLAMSSRNEYLTPEERRAAPVLFQSLETVRELFEAGERSSAVLLAALGERLATEPLVGQEYAELVDRQTLDPIETIERPALCAVAALLGQTRLIDNVTLAPPRAEEA